MKEEIHLFQRSDIEKTFHVSPSTVSNWEKRGILHPIRIHGSNKIFYRPNDILRLIDNERNQNKFNDNKFIEYR